MSFLTEVLFFMGAFSGLLLAGIVAANIVTKNLFWIIVKVRLFGRRKGLVAVRVYSVTGIYYRSGQVAGNILTYAPKNNKQADGTKLDKKITLQPGDIKRDFGTNLIEINEHTNEVLNINWSVSPGFDAELIDMLMKRIAMLRKLNKKEMIILIVCVITMLVVFYIAFKVGKLETAIQALNDVKETAGAVVSADAGNIGP